MSLEQETTPVTVIAGAWGAGKSSVIDRLLDTVGQSPAVICTGFGHDHGAVATIHCEQELLHLTNGCACCAVRTDLVEALDDLLDQRDPPSHVLIEASAGSDLATIAQTFLRTPSLRRSTSLRGLVTVVDGLAVGTTLRATSTIELTDGDANALAMSDLVVVNRLESLVPSLEQQTAWELWSRTASRQIQIDHPHPGLDPLPRRILDAVGFDPTRQAIRLQGRSNDDLGGPANDRPLRHLRLRTPGELDRERLDDWIGSLQSTMGAGLLRWTGRFAVAGNPTGWLAQGVRTSVLVDDAPPSAGPPESVVDVIGRISPGLDLARTFAECRA